VLGDALSARTPHSPPALSRTSWGTRTRHNN
jgi:hypothetical protein